MLVDERRCRPGCAGREQVISGETGEVAVLGPQAEQLAAVDERLHRVAGGCAQLGASSQRLGVIRVCGERGVETDQLVREGGRFSGGQGGRGDGENAEEHSAATRPPRGCWRARRLVEMEAVETVVKGENLVSGRAWRIAG